MTNDMKRRGTSELAIIGSHANTKVANLAIQKASEEGHLVAPASCVGELPEGCTIAISRVDVDLSSKKNGNFTNYTSGDVYDVGMGKLGLSKTVLQKIGAAIGVSWDPVASGRVDDGSDPKYCRWRAVGRYRSFDGQIQLLVAEKEMDLRDGSAQVDALWERYETKKRFAKAGEKAPKSPEGQIREMRLHIQAHAESKAQLRALRSLGIKTAYTESDLRRPFYAARVMFTGRSEDPGLRAMFAEKVADSFLDSQRSLFGAQPVQPAQQPPMRLVSPPPVGSVQADDSGEYDVDTGEVHQPEPAQRSKPAGRPAQAARGAKTGGSSGGGFTIPGGPAKGTPLSEADDKYLYYWHERIGDSLNKGESRDEERDSALFEELDAEVRRRSGGSAAAGTDDGSDEPQQGEMY